MRFRPTFIATLVAVAFVSLAALRIAAVATTVVQSSHTLVQPNSSYGHRLISDQFNNRVIEVDPRNHQIVWHFGNGSNMPGPKSVVGPNDAERAGLFTLISGTGVPPASPPLEPGCGNGCPDNRVILVDNNGNIAWQYGKAGVTGSGPDELNTPVCSVLLPNGDVLITDQGNARIIEVTTSHNSIVWQYGRTGHAGSGPGELNNPNSAELLANGHILIADESNNRVIEVDRAKQIVWQYGAPKQKGRLNGAAFASRLPNGNTLITDSNNNRILEVDAGKTLLWTYATNTQPGSVQNPLPTRAVRLKSGLTLISNQFDGQVIAVTQKFPSGGNIVWSQGVLGVNGNKPGELNAPYDAKDIGDFTGLTPPQY